VLRAYIVDDEALAVERLTRLLRQSGRVEIAGATTDPGAAVDYLAAHDVDVVFLDIQMPALTGFDVLERLGRTGRDVRVIFTTAYDRYAVEAFTVNSVDYLLKPVEPDRLGKALDKLERLSAPAAADLRALARELARQLDEAGSRRGAQGGEPASPAPGPRRLERIASRVGERTTLVELARVTHFFSKDKLTFAASGGREHVIDFTLAELEERLDRRFVRIHRGTIVNIGFVQELHPGIEGVLVRLRDERRTELSVARDRVKELKERLGI
jgi:two-component system LytT family response regulator